MARTFEALMKAAKEHQIRPEEAKVFDLKPHGKPHIPPNFIIAPQIIEEYQRMKHHIADLDPKEKIKTLLFCSSADGEGVSTVVINFAITLTTSSEKVLLVDANLRNPTIHDLFSVERKIGLTELLLGTITLNDAIKKTQNRNLSVITTGIPHSNPSAVFESPLFDSLIQQMKAQADWILFDAPAINSYNDASILASKLDGVVIVVQAEKTRWEVVQSARERIEKGRIKILGIVLNRRKKHIPEWAYKML